MERKFTRIVSAIMSVVMFVFAIMDISFINAEGTTTTVIADGSNVKISKNFATIDGVTITSDMNIENGDVIDFVFEWELLDDKIKPPAMIVCDLSSVLKNIKLDNKNLTTSNSAKYEVSGQVLKITLESGESGREGKFNLSGVIDLSGAQLNSSGKVEVKLIDQTFLMNVPDLISDLSVEKSHGSIRYENGEYYIPFTVKIENKSKATAENVTFTDIFKYGDDGMYDSAELCNLRVDGVEKTLSTGTELSLGSIDPIINDDPSTADNGVVITYDLKVSPDKALAGKWHQNIAQVEFYNGYTDITKESHQWPSVPKPAISKNGTLAADKSHIDWEIQVTPGLFFEDSGSGSDFIVIDTPDGTFLTASDIVAATGGTDNGDGTVTIDKNKFTKDGDVYKYSYTTSLDSDISNTVLGVKIKNSAKAVFELDGAEYPTGDASKEIAIVADVTGTIVEKTGTYNSATGMLDWVINAYIPNDPSMTKVTITENTNEGTNIHHVDFDGVQIYVDGTLKNYTIDRVQNTDYEKEQRFEIVFGDGKNPLSEVIGKTVTVKLSSDPQDSAAESLIYKNKANVYIANQYNSISRGATATVSPHFTASKYGYVNNTGAATWTINVVNSGTETYTEADTIVVTDTLPEGVIFDNSANNYAQVNYGSWFTPTVTTAGQTIRFEFTLSGENLANFNKPNNFINVVFGTKLTEAGYADIQLKTPQGSSYELVNNAEVTIKGNTVPVRGSVNIPVNHEKLLDKNILSSSVIEKDRFRATYAIEVNKEEIDIVPASDIITVTDTLGIWLEVDKATVSITDASGNLAPEAYFAVNKNNIVFTLGDSKHYKITYDVVGKQVPLASTLSQDDIELLFNNTVALEGRNGNNISSEVLVDESTFEIGGIYMYNITIRGTKVWSDKNYSAARPKKIDIEVECTKVDIRGNKTAYEPYSKKISVLVGVDPTTNVWKYEIPGLVSMDEFCNSYEYKIKEVTVDGYSGVATYADGSKLEAITTDCNIIITNTFDAHTKEIGDVKVNKNWVDGNGSTRPASVTFVIKDASGNEVDRKSINVANNETTATFTGLPLYTYSRDSSDNLVRTPIVYTIEEINAGSNYTVSYSDENGALTDGKFKIVDVGTPGVASEAKILTVTNTADATPENTTTTTTTTVDGGEPIETSTSPDETTTVVGGDVTPETTTIPNEAPTTSSDDVVTTSEKNTTASDTAPDATSTSATSPDGFVTTQKTTVSVTEPTVTTSVTTKTGDGFGTVGTTVSSEATTLPISDVTTTTRMDGFGTTATSSVTTTATSENVSSSTTRDDSFVTLPVGTTTCEKPIITPSATTTKVTETTTVTSKTESDDEAEDVTDESEIPVSEEDIEDVTTTAEKPDSTTEAGVDTSTDTTLPPDDLLEDDGNYDDFPGGSDSSDVSSRDEENPNTSVTIPVSFVAAAVFGVYAAYPRRKKRK